MLWSRFIFFLLHVNMVIVQCSKSSMENQPCKTVLTIPWAMNSVPFSWQWMQDVVKLFLTRSSAPWTTSCYCSAPGSHVLFLISLLSAPRKSKRSCCEIFTSSHLCICVFSICEGVVEQIRVVSDLLVSVSLSCFCIWLQIENLPMMILFLPPKEETEISGKLLWWYHSIIGKPKGKGFSPFANLDQPKTSSLIVCQIQIAKQNALIIKHIQSSLILSFKTWQALILNQYCKPAVI